jgi:hypothetical protein
MNIAIIENNIVVNTIVCESVELAESLTGLTAVEYTNENPAGIDWTYNSITNQFIPPRPYASWTFNEEAKQWQAPVSYPVDGKNYTWTEENLTWVEVVS